MAIVAVRRGAIEQHQEWMIRSYVVTFAFVTFRSLWSILQRAGVGTTQEQLGVASWFCWAVPLLILEVALQGRRILGPRHVRAAVLVALALTMPAHAHAQAGLSRSFMDEVQTVLCERVSNAGRARSWPQQYFSFLPSSLSPRPRPWG
jgi:hypothetical protein